MMREKKSCVVNIWWLCFAIVMMVIVVSVIAWLPQKGIENENRQRIFLLEQLVEEIDMRSIPEASPYFSNMFMFELAHSYHGVLHSFYDLEKRRWSFERGGEKMSLFTEAFIKSLSKEQKEVIGK